MNEKPSTFLTQTKELFLLLLKPPPLYTPDKKDSPYSCPEENVCFFNKISEPASSFQITPLIYVISYFLSIFFLVLLKFLDSDPKKITSLPNLFEIPTINPTICFILSGTSFVSSVLLMFFLHNLIDQRLKAPEYKSFNLKLHLMSLTALLYSTIELLFIGLPNFQFYRLNSCFVSIQTKIFIVKLIFLAAYVLFSLSIIKVFQFSSVVQKSSYSASKIKLVILTYLYIILLSYCISLFQPSLFNDLTGQFMAENTRKNLILYCPYLLASINALLIYSIKFEIAFLETSLKKNAEVDYLFEETLSNI